VSYKFVAGDTGSVLRVTCTNDSDGTAINLTGSTVVLRWFNRATEAVIEQTMTLVTPASGICSYQFAAGELVSPSMAFEVKITDGSGKVIRSLNLLNEAVREKLP
jgi:hypothetical protein